MGKISPENVMNEAIIKLFATLDFKNQWRSSHAYSGSKHEVLGATVRLQGSGMLSFKILQSLGDHIQKLEVH